MARPTKSEAEQRKFHRSVHLSDYELSTIQRKADASNMKIGSYLREAALKQRVVMKQDIGRVNFLLANMSNNLNQIAKWANTYKNDADAGEVLEALLILERQLEDLGREVRS